MLGGQLPKKWTDTVYKYDTERPTVVATDKLIQIKRKINALASSNSLHVIAVEKLEGATGEWFRYVATMEA